LVVTGQLFWTFTVFISLKYSVQGGPVQIATWTFTMTVQRGHDTDKLGRVDQPLRGRTEVTLVDEFVEGGT